LNRRKSSSGKEKGHGNAVPLISFACCDGTAYAHATAAITSTIVSQATFRNFFMAKTSSGVNPNLTNAFYRGPAFFRSAQNG
jgi:hypothetical protein